MFPARHSATPARRLAQGPGRFRRSGLLLVVSLALVLVAGLGQGQARDTVAAPSGTMVAGPGGMTAAAAAPVVGNAGSKAGRQTKDKAKSVRLRVRKVQAAGPQIAWAAIGKGRPLLLLNGTGSPMSQWDPALLAGLAQHRRVIVFDYPGLGESGAAPSRITFAALADWTAALLTQIGVDRTDVLGWSMGGFVAQELLTGHDDRLRRVVLAGTNPGGPRTEFGPKWAQRIDSNPDAGIAGYLATNYPRTQCAQAAGQASVRRVNRAIWAGRYPKDRVPNRTYRAMVRAENAWYRSSRNMRLLKHNPRRVWVVTGEADVVTPKSNTRRLARALPRATRTVVRNAGHAFLFQDPEMVASKSLRFLRSGKPARALPGKLSTDCGC